MTKYILVGGYPSKAADGGKAFCEEVVKGFEEPVKILDCIFARPKEVWGEVFAEDKKFFASNLPDKNFELRLADPKKFIDQMKWANAIYMRGGKTEQLTRVLNTVKGWTTKLDGKTLAGTSAGANVMARFYYTLDGLKMSEGFGLLPIKVIVHYRSNYNAPNIDWDKAYSALKDYKEELPIIALREGEFRVQH